MVYRILMQYFLYFFLKNYLLFIIFDDLKHGE